METTRDGLWRFRGLKDDMLTALQDNPIAAAVRADERARIKRNLLAEIQSFLDQEIHPDDPLHAGRRAERSFFAESLRLSLDRICPEEG